MFDDLASHGARPVSPAGLGKAAARIGLSLPEPVEGRQGSLGAGRAEPRGPACASGPGGEGLPAPRGMPPKAGGERLPLETREGTAVALGCQDALRCFHPSALFPGEA